MTQRGLRPPSVGDITRQASVNVPGVAGAVWWPLFDYQTLAATAVASQQFFAVPYGSGGKTETDTNMSLAGQIPSGQRFVITGVGIDILPNLLPSTGDALAAAAANNDFVNDVYQVLKGGRLKLTIGSKDYVNHGNLMKFPSVNRLGVAFGAATTVAASNQSYGYAAGAGREFAVVDAVLMANQNFSVTLYDLPALPSAVAGRIGVNLYGWLFRNAQ